MDVPPGTPVNADQHGSSSQPVSKASRALQNLMKALQVAQFKWCSLPRPWPSAVSQLQQIAKSLLESSTTSDSLNSRVNFMNLTVSKNADAFVKPRWFSRSQIRQPMRKPKHQLQWQGTHMNLWCITAQLCMPLDTSVSSRLSSTESVDSVFRNMPLMSRRRKLRMHLFAYLLPRSLQHRCILVT